ncbi:endonuclease/exonuclease/phosphatase family protein [Cytophaga sp. FL35]|uniref:endonuclease/exonuclease/phosphatase family protein n=1 Tax=Cytophaga sp. FL35 TaxID=1904456 RepID=UPI001CA3FEE1|nr:endonuclease/exonuclease/phosphatase family protein [Cytophaga sp. FL35]
MKKNLLLSSLLFLAFACAFAQSPTVMTYNIKYDNKEDQVNNWNFRKEAMVDLIHNQRPDVIGMQEVLHRQLEFLDKGLDNYAYVGVGRDDGKEKGEYSPIFYNSSEYEVLESNTFWLSRSPEKVSVGWDASMERICTYARFREKKSQKEFWMFNTHFDHRGDKARKKSVRLILKKIDEINSENLPVVLTGDLNLLPEQAPIQYLSKRMSDGLETSRKKNEGPHGTFNGFNLEDPISNRIDYIFTRGFSVNNYQHIDERLENDNHISDHLPVVAELVR